MAKARGLMILNVKMNLLRCMPSVWLLNLLLKRKKIFVAIMLCCPILCLLWVLPLKTNRCIFLHTKETKKWRERLLSLSLRLGLILEIWVDLSLFLLCHHCGVIGHIRPQCSMLKREQNHAARSLHKKPSELKPIVCHHCGAFGHLRACLDTVRF